MGISSSPSTATAIAPDFGPEKPKIKALDGLRGPICVGVIAINMNLYNTGANTLVGFFLVLSGVTSYLAYGDKVWDEVARHTFFKKRIIRLLPMLLISTTWQMGVSISYVEVKDGEGLFGNILSLLLLFTPLCCKDWVYKWKSFSLFLVWAGALMNGPGWYVGCLLYISIMFIPKILAAMGGGWASVPPSWTVLLLWALAEGLQYGLPLLVYYLSGNNEALWYYSTLWLYLAMPPFFR